MSTQRGEAPALHRRGLESAPISNVFARRRPSRIVPACILGFLAFSICFLAGHILAAIFGWHGFVYVGFGFGCWFFASAVVAFCMTGVMRDD